MSINDGASRRPVGIRGVAVVGAALLLVDATATPSFAAEEDGSSDAIEVIASIAPESLEAVSADEGIVVADDKALQEDEFGRSVVE